METKHTKEYAEQLGDKYENTFTQPNGTESVDFAAGYMKAIEETAAPELLEVLQEIMDCPFSMQLIIEHRFKAFDAIKKATT